MATAATVVPVEKFNAVELHGGGTITIRQAAVQRVTVIEATARCARGVVDRGEAGS